MSAAEKIILGLFVAFLCVAFASAVSLLRNFKESCKAHGGETVYKFRRWECIK